MMWNTKQYLLLAACGLFLATQPGASCVSDEPISDSPRRYPADDRYNDRNADRIEEDANYIPQRADIVREGRDEITFRSDADGELYIQDLKDERTIVRRRITRGQVVTVSPDENRIRLDDDTISKADLKRDHTHRIYLLRDRRFEDDRRSDRDNQDRLNDRNTPRKRDVEALPSGAQAMGEGRNKEISFSPSRDGKAYVYDTSERRVVAVADVKAKKRFVFSPGADRITVDGKRVVQQDFDTKTSYRVYFAR